MSDIAYLDTNIVIRLLSGDKLLETARDVINRSDLFVSGMVLLELQMLYEAGKLSLAPDKIWAHLGSQLNISLCSISMTEIMRTACRVTWTREPGDRVIVANAINHGNARLITTDRKIQDNYACAVKGI